MCHVGIPKDDYYRDALTSLKQLTSIGEAWKIRLEKFCHLYARHYAIVAEVARPSSNQVALTYSQRLPRESSEDRKHDHLRRIFGLSPTAIDLPLALYAFLADSYHLQLNAVPGQYILDHHLEEMGSRKKIVEKADFENLFVTDPQIGRPALPYVRLRQGKARTNAHLYIRRQRSVSHAAELKSVFEFREIPPGTLGGAAVVAGASALIITFFAVTRFGLYGDRDFVTAAINSDLPAILLAIPAFVAALIGPWSDLSRIARAALSTYFGLVTTLLLSVASVLHYILDANMELFTEMLIFGFQAEIIWLILMLTSLFLFIYLISELLSQMRRYVTLVERWPVNKNSNTVKNGKGAGV